MPVDAIGVLLTLYDVVNLVLKLKCMNLFVLKKRFQSLDHLAKDSIGLAGAVEYLDPYG